MGYMLIAGWAGVAIAGALGVLALVLYSAAARAERRRMTAPALRASA